MLLGLIGTAQRARTNRLLADQVQLMRTGQTVAEVRAQRWAASPRGQRTQRATDQLLAKVAARKEAAGDLAGAAALRAKMHDPVVQPR